MGGEVRAETVSNLLGITPFMKWFVKLLLGKCGNCPFRLKCWSRLFPNKGLLFTVYREVFYCVGTESKLYRNFGKDSFDGKQVVKLITNCAGCNQYLYYCCKQVLKASEKGELMGLDIATSNNPDDHVAVIRRCAACPFNVACWSDKMRKLKFHWWAKIPTIYRINRDCVKKDKDGEKDGQKNVCVPD